MKRTEILQKLLTAKLNNEVIQLKVEPSPFETNYYEFADFSVIQPNLSQIAIFNKEQMIIADFHEITTFMTRPINANDLAKKVVSMSDDELNENKDDLDLTLETVKENKKIAVETELIEYIKSKMSVDTPNSAIENILSTAWKNTYGNVKIECKAVKDGLSTIKKTIDVIVKEMEELEL